VEIEPSYPSNGRGTNRSEIQATHKGPVHKLARDERYDEEECHETKQQFPGQTCEEVDMQHRYDVHEATLILYFFEPLSSMCVERDGV
jgi:hypothetical protein